MLWQCPKALLVTWTDLGCMNTAVCLPSSSFVVCSVVFGL